MANRNSKGLEVMKANAPLEKMKLEIASELGIPDYDKIDKGSLPSRVNGQIGGNMVRKMITSYENLVSNPETAAIVQKSNPVDDKENTPSMQ